MLTNSEPKDSSLIQADKLLSAACDYLARDWSIIPLSEKRPAIPHWKEFQARRPVLDEIQNWFASSLLQVSGLGIVTGRLSGLVVVDCDCHEDAIYWQENFSPSPLQVATGGGGLHCYYRMPDSSTIRNCTRLGGRKIDLRGEGGYVVAPPSGHTSGRHYAWQNCDLVTPIPDFEDGWIIEKQQQYQFQASHSTRQIRHAVKYIQRIVAVSGEGGHNATFRAACKLRDGGLSAQEALTILTDWNETNAVPPWSVRELAHKIRSAYQGNTKSF